MNMHRAAQQTPEIIAIDDDHDIDLRGIVTRAPVEAREATKEYDEDSMSTSTFIDLTKNDGLDEDHEESVSTFTYIDLSEDDGLDEDNGLDGQDYLREATPCPLRDSSPNVPYAYRQINSVKSLAGTLNFGEYYELTDGDFLLVK
ncbi:hypothetical protein KC365_g13133 [Hortaea werneckii]|nr:hypothetical protein KC323_g8060 [Hortaea werneckii]KAI7216833.1 hypothetical protein KC365_g13133 [Hortaea werneckii]